MKINFKKSFFFLLLFIALNSFAQDGKSRFSYGLSVTPMVSQHISDNQNRATFETKLNGSVVADIYMRAGKQLQIRSGLGVRTVVAEGKNQYLYVLSNIPQGVIEVISTCVDFTSNTYYLSVPLGLKFDLTEKWFADIGLENNFKLRTNGDWTRTSCEDTSRRIDVAFDRYYGTEYLPTFYAGFGYEPNLGDKWNLILEPYFNVGLKKSLAQVIDGVAPDFVTNARLLNFGLRLGVVFNK